MNKPWKWALFAAACILMAINWTNADFSAYEQLSPSELLPVLLITGAIFLIKTGVLSALLVALKKLWDRIKRK